MRGVVKCLFVGGIAIVVLIAVAANHVGPDGVGEWFQMIWERG